MAALLLDLLAGDAAAKAFLELINAATGAGLLLLTRAERVAGRAHIKVHIARTSRASFDHIATAASGSEIAVFGVYISFHQIAFWF